MGITGRAWHQKAVTELDLLLNQWVDHIPEHRKQLLSYQVCLGHLTNVTRSQMGREPRRYCVLTTVCFSVHYLLRSPGALPQPMFFLFPHSMFRRSRYVYLLGINVHFLILLSSSTRLLFLARDKNLFSPSLHCLYVQTPPEHAFMRPHHSQKVQFYLSMSWWGSCFLVQRGVLKGISQIPVFNSGIVLLMNIWRAKRSPGSGVNFDREMQAMYKCFDILTDFSRR